MNASFLHKLQVSRIDSKGPLKKQANQGLEIALFDGL